MAQKPTPVSFERHGTLRFPFPPSYGFARETIFVPLTGNETQRAAVDMPIAFVEEDGHFALVAVLGFEPGQNLFISSDGRWLSDYIPARLRQHPFSLRALNGEENKLVVCVTDDASLSETEGEPLFERGGGQSLLFQRISAFLMEMRRDEEATRFALAALAEYKLIAPWPAEVEGSAGTHRINGLFRIDAAALDTLPDPGFQALRRANALPIAYAQMLSAGRLTVLGWLDQRRRQP